MLLWLSCQTTKEPEIKTIVYVPDLYFPAFPKLKPEVCIPIDANGKRVTDEDTEIMYYMVAPYYIDQLAQFKVNYKVTEAGYEAAKETYSQK